MEELKQAHEKSLAQALNEAIQDHERALKDVEASYEKNLRLKTEKIEILENKAGAASADLLKQLEKANQSKSELEKTLESA